MKEETRVQVPGYMIARIQNGEITGFDFTPAAADAGYFGDEINVIEGQDIDSDAFFDLVSNKLVHSPDYQSSSFTANWVC
jgi:hypothetical protein